MPSRTARPSISNPPRATARCRRGESVRTPGRPSLIQEPLPEIGAVETYTVVHVAAEKFNDDTPYVSAVVDFGPVALTGILRGVDPEAVAVGDEVTVTVEPRETTDDRLVVFRPA